MKNERDEDMEVSKISVTLKQKDTEIFYCVESKIQICEHFGETRRRQV